MIKKLFILFKLGRKLAKSDVLNIVSKFKTPPLAVKILFKILSFSFSSSQKLNYNVSEGERLSKSLQSMGTTFIKLGQFLVTRPDIIGDELAKQLEGLQDRLPAFSLSEAKKIINKDLGDETYNSIIDLSEPVAAASIAQVHKAKINDNGTIKDVAIKILRPNIKKIFNEEIDALMLFAFIVESFIKKTKRLKLVEVVFLLKEITNLEMDLRFEAAAANEYAENTKNDVGFKVPQIYWNFTSENVMTLDWVDGVSIRETETLQKRNIDTKQIASDIIQHFLRHAVRDGFFHADMHQGNIFIDDNGTIKDVAIKILRPDIKKIFNEEIDAMMLFAFIVESFAKKTKRLKLVEVVFLLKEITNLEMDLRFEAAAANEYAENTKNDAGFKVPQIYWNFTSENVMTLDWIDGVSIRETEELKNRNLDTNKIAEDIIQHFLRHAVRDGFFHADMHQGNIFIDNSGQIAPIDFGIMGRLDKVSKRFLAEILYGFIQRDYKKVAEVHLVAGLVPNNVPIDDLAQALRSIGEPIFGQAVKDISGGKLLKQLFDVTEKFNMQTQPQLLMLQKTMVVVEGVARKLNPDTNIWTTSKPVLESWLRETKDPINSITDTLNNTSEVLKRLPEFPEIMDKANQALTYLASGQIPQNSNSYTALNNKKSEMTAFRNQSIIGLLVLVIIGLLVF